jgi:peptidoglycan hydrolase FlgJ
VATQFEAMFMQMVLKSMRDASPKSGLLDSSEQQTYTGMLDEQLAQKIAAGGTGLGDVIARQLSRNLPHAPTPPAGRSAESAAAAPWRPGAGRRAVGGHPSAGRSCGLAGHVFADHPRGAIRAQRKMRGHARPGRRLRMVGAMPQTRLRSERPNGGLPQVLGGARRYPVTVR